MLFDTHAHYDDERYDEDRDLLLNSLKDEAVDLVVNAGSGLTQSKRGLEIAQKYPFVYAAIGVHPHEASTMDSNSIAFLSELLKSPKAVAVGEIGLDYHYDFSPREVQRLRFAEQLELAKRINKPIIIHEREAFEDVMGILSDFRGITLVVHCFSGDIEAARRVLDNGWMISFTGTVTFKKSTSLAVSAYVPLDRLMIETDAPYLAPVPVRGQRNDSRYLIHIAQKIAEARGITVEELAEATTQNGIRFFGIQAY